MTWLFLLPVLFFALFFWHPQNHHPALPSFYSASAKGFVTPVKKQKWGTCWTFATASSMESDLLKSHYLGHTIPDLSEYYLDKYSGLTRNGQAGERQSGWYSGQGSGYLGSNSDDPNSGAVVHLGGDYIAAAAFLSNTRGMIEEKSTIDVIDFESFGNLPTSGVLKKNNYSYYRPQKILWPSMEQNPALRRQLIKEMIIQYGSVASIQKMEDRPFGKTANGEEIHFYDGEERPDHSINIVGWDDEFSFKQFEGAWLIKDSDHIDESTGKKIGLFWTPYADKYTGSYGKMGAVAFAEVRATPFKKIYSHAHHGNRYTKKQNPKLWRVANRYSGRFGEHITHLSFYTEKFNQKVKLFLGDHLADHHLVYEQTVRVPGLYTVKLNHPFKVKGDFVLVMEQPAGSYSHDGNFSLDILLSGALPKKGAPIKVNAKSNIGQSFYQDQFGVWEDAIHLIPSGNWAINAYSK